MTMEVFFFSPILSQKVGTFTSLKFGKRTS